MKTSKKKYNILNDCRGLFEDEVFEIIMQERGIDDPEHFLNPTEDDLLPLDDLKNIDKAYRLLVDAVYKDKRIAVHFDTDTDGITSGAIMTRYLKNMTENPVDVYINRGKQHGLTNQDIAKFYGYDLLIVVDSLDKDETQYKDLKETGVDVIVLDHHAIDPDVPYDNYCTLVSSQREYENPQLSGAGVVWKFCKYIDEQNGTDYADDLVDLAGVGLIADMMNMRVMENRYIVSEALKEIRNPAIKKIIGGFEFNSTAVAFSIAPLVNAANRMDQNEIALNAFLEDDNKKLRGYIKQLKQCKEDQNEEVAQLMPMIAEQCEAQSDKKMITTFIDTDYGISGLIGNKLLEKYQKPILVLKKNEDTYAGSMRAVGVKDFRQMCNNSQLAEANGHELASGIEIPRKNFAEFTSYIEETLPDKPEDTTIDVDIMLDISDITRKMVDMIKKIDRISGQGFKPVRVYIEEIDDYDIGQMSNYKHLVLKPCNNDKLWIIKWNYDGSFEDMEDHSMMNDEFCAVTTLDCGFFGRKFVLKAVCDSLEEVG